MLGILTLLLPKLLKVEFNKHSKYPNCEIYHVLICEFFPVNIFIYLISLIHTYAHAQTPLDQGQKQMQNPKLEIYFSFLESILSTLKIP